MLKNLFQKVFNFGQQEKEIEASETALKKEPSITIQKKRETLSECCSLSRIAKNQRYEKSNAEALITLEKIIVIMEQEKI